MAGSPITEELEFLKAVVVKRHVVPADAEQCADAPQLSLEVNEVVYVLEQDESGWWGGHKEGDADTKGWFPGNCVRVVTDDSVMSETAWGGVFPETLAEEDEGGHDDSVLASRGPAVPHAVGAMRLSTPTFPGASEDDPSNPRVAVAADGTNNHGSERSFQFQAALSTAEVRANGEDLQQALKEIEELKAVNETLRHQSQQTIQMLQHRSEAAEKEAHAARQELERQSKRHAEMQEELQRTKRHSEVQVSELKTFFEKQMEQKQQKEVELNKKVADIAARYESLREELHAHGLGKEEASQQSGSTRSVAEELHHAKRHSEVQVSELKRFFEQQSQPKHPKDFESNKQVANSAARYESLRAERHARGSGKDETPHHPGRARSVAEAHTSRSPSRPGSPLRRSDAQVAEAKVCLALQAPTPSRVIPREVKLDVARDDPHDADPSPLGLVETIGRSRPRTTKPTGKMTTAPALPVTSPVR
mmetsp:Transcript_59160/g.109320  ORF Transcript_59160/g.109320 Transcript_59160/m.109320 type:complete len:477 (-) Transcript_59160:108-1538(-)